MTHDQDLLPAPAVAEAHGGRLNRGQMSTDAVHVTVNAVPTAEAGDTVNLWLTGSGEEYVDGLTVGDGGSVVFAVPADTLPAAPAELNVSYHLHRSSHLLGVSEVLHLTVA
ncbi:hypothetical protein ACQPZG_01375 (plasmid) [Streptomyces sp. CA-294286]|uniref:hypothetical protein n=1 Tax=Streptomyces sp. CA-294286 TaxID=3240070 RepID=UPI003D8B8074